LIRFFIYFNFYIDIDEKEEGGVQAEITFGFTTKTSYKAAQRAKTKGRLYDLQIKIQQDRYSSTGNAWKVWDSAIVLARYCVSFYLQVSTS
jgi:hypothetical protein